MDNISYVTEVLTANNISYKLFRHKAVFIMDTELDLGDEESNSTVICKNLFLCDDKKTKCFLVVLKGDKKVDLKMLAQKLNIKAMRFASDNRLYQYLGLTKGAVSPLGIINDKSRTVTVIFDDELIGCKTLRVHPNDNSATVIISFDDIKRLIETYGNPIIYVNFD